MASTADGAAPQPTAPKGKRRLVLMTAGGIFLLGGGATAAYFGGLLPAATPAHAESPGVPPPATEAHGTPAEAAQVFFVDLPDIIVNLQSTGTRMRFLRLRLALEVGDEPSGQKVKSLTPRLLDSFQLYLRALTPDDVSGAGGMQRLKEDLIARSNIAVAPMKVADVLLKEMLVQ